MDCRMCGRNLSCPSEEGLPVNGLCGSSVCSDLDDLAWLPETYGSSLKPKPVDTDRLWRQLKTSGRMCFSLGLPERTE